MMYYNQMKETGAKLWNLCAAIKLKDRYIEKIRLKAQLKVWEKKGKLNLEWSQFDKQQRG